MARETLEQGDAARRESAGRVVSAFGGERVTVADEIEHERHERSVRPCRRVSSGATIQSEFVACRDPRARVRYMPDLAGAAAAKSFELRSTVIMNPFVPLNS